jgi:hypothetical protein
MSMHPIETRLLALERRVFHLAQPVLALEGRVAAVGQGLWQSWSQATGCTITLHVTVVGCDGSGVDGATVTCGPSSGTTDDRGGVRLTLAQAGTYTPTATAASPRFAPTSAPPASLSCGNVYDVTIPLEPAAGYVCTPVCPAPIQAALTLTDSVIAPGGIALDWDGTAWVGCTGYSFAACGAYGCGAVDTAVRYVLNPGANVVAISFPTAGAGALCPGAGSCPGPWSPQLSAQATLVRFDCSPLTIVNTSGSGLLRLYCDQQATITITES